MNGPEMVPNLQGRELDAAVHLDVMGEESAYTAVEFAPGAVDGPNTEWRPAEYRNGSWGLPDDVEIEGAFMFRETPVDDLEAPNTVVSCPEYSTNIADAFDVVERMMRRFGIRIGVTPDLTDSRRRKFTVATEYHDGLNIIGIELEDVPEAICRVAFVAVKRRGS